MHTADPMRETRTEPLTHDAFSRCVGNVFRIDLGNGETLELRLAEVSDLVLSSRQERFSILFSGPSGVHLSQRIYRLVHESMGSIDLFLVPISRNANGFQYEAVFNRLRRSD